MTYNILGIHDAGGMSWMADSPGFVCISEALGCDPNDTSGVDYRPLSSAGLGVIVRLNNGYYPGGTIPTSDRYVDFAARCAHFVAASPGCQRWIIANEPNHSQERPNGQPIYPDQYVDCYRQCRDAIHQVQPEAEVLVAAVAPWNLETGDWLLYFGEVLAELNETGCDGIALHTYTHGSDPALITSTATMDPPYADRYFHFLAYQDFLLCVPPALRHLPVYLTETDMDVAWTDVNDGWIQRAAMEIDGWNRTEGTQKIHCLCCYRWSGDQWALADKPQRLQDFAQALSLGISSPAAGCGPGAAGPEEPSEPPTPEPEPIPPAASSPQPAASWDPRLDARGAVLVRAQAQPGHFVWRCVEGRWFDEAESQGRVSVFVEVLDEAGQRAVGANLLWGWSDVTTEKFAENKSDPWLTEKGYDGCAADFPMQHTAPTYWTCPDGLSDRVEGLGLGDLERPGMTIHTSYYLKFVLMEEPDATPIPPEPGNQKLIWPVDGPITQYFGSHGISYPGEPGHDGMDFGVAMGTPVRAPGDGIVKMVDNDEAGFGLYIRIYLPAYGFHGVLAHLSEQHVTIGQQVKQGQIVGLSGNSGNSSGPHCHYSCRLGTEEDYYELHDGYDQGATNPMTVYALVNLEDPNLY